MSDRPPDCSATIPAPIAGKHGDRLFAAMQCCLPTRALSGLVFRLAQVRWGPVKDLLIRLFLRVYTIDLNEAEQTRADAYASFNAFFTRALRPGARPLPPDVEALASPVDGTVSQCTTIAGGRLIQAKGRDYSALELLGGNAEAAQRFAGGTFCTLYLAPSNYHRIHMPFDGTLRSWSYVPGRLFSVNPATARAMPDLFARNERLVAHLETKCGPLALVMVGALFVGSLETVWAGRVSPPHRRGHRPSHFDMVHPPRFARGTEIGRFNMGSTVILMAPPGMLDWNPEITAGLRLRMGQTLARCRAATGGVP